MKFKSLYFFILLFIVFNEYSLVAQNIFSKKFSIDNGLLSTDNYSVYQDLTGYIWICSERGISKFDGYTFKYFTTNQGLHTNDIWGIIVDSKNRKWLRSFAQGIQYIENDKVKSIKEAEHKGQFYYAGEHEDTIFFNLENSDRSQTERYFFAPNATFGKYNPTILKGYRLKHDFRENGVKILKGISTNDEVLLDVSSGSFSKSKFSGFSSVESGYCRENESIFYLNKKYFSLENCKFNELDFSNVPTSSINRITRDVKSGYLFIHTDNFHFAFLDIVKQKRDDKIERILNESLDLKGKKIASVLIDTEGNLWVTEFRGEIYFFPFNAIWYSTLKSGNHLLGNSVSPLKINEDTYFVVRPNQLYKYDNNFNVGIIKSNVYSIRHIERYKNNLLAMSASELLLIQSEQDEITQQEIIYTNDGALLKCFKFLNEEQIIFNTGEIYSLRLKKIIRKLNFPKGASKLVIKDSVVICANENELKVIDLKSNKNRTIQFKNIHLLKEIDNYFAIAYESNKLKIISFNLDLKEKSKYSFEFHINDVVKFNDQLYIATDRELFSSKVSDKERKIELLLESKLYGFQINNLLVTKKSITFFTSKGVYLFDKSKIENNTRISNIPFEIQIKDIGNRNKYNNIQLSYNHNSPQFNFHSISYYNLGELVCRYKLEGNDTIFHYTSNPSITYSNLKPGKYKLHVSVSRSKLEKFQEEKLLAFEITPSLFDSILFRVVFFIAFGAIIWGVILLTKKITQANEARKLKFIDLELRALRAQLNPHFVFNSLNTIQSMIFLKSPQEANIYITSFADLIRSVLDSSRMNKISLKDKIKFLDGYLSLEQRRLNNTLDYTIKVGKRIDPSKLMVYTMVFQPFIENAIIHAFRNEQENKKLNIHFYLNDTTLVTEIEDNGIGINTSIQSNKTKIHISHASMILKEKAQLLNSIKKDELLIEVLDLMEKEARPGTKVIIKMKIEFIN